MVQEGFQLLLVLPMDVGGFGGRAGGSCGSRGERERQLLRILGGAAESTVDEGHLEKGRAFRLGI